MARVAVRVSVTDLDRDRESEWLDSKPRQWKEGGCRAVAMEGVGDGHSGEWPPVGVDGEWTERATHAAYISLTMTVANVLSDPHSLHVLCVYVSCSLAYACDALRASSRGRG